MGKQLLSVGEPGINLSNTLLGLSVDTTACVETAACGQRELEERPEEIAARHGSSNNFNDPLRFS
jgi:hypothetical protein